MASRPPRTSKTESARGASTGRVDKPAAISMPALSSKTPRCSDVSFPPIPTVAKRESPNAPIGAPSAAVSHRAASSMIGWKRKGKWMRRASKVRD